MKKNFDTLVCLKKNQDAGFALVSTLLILALLGTLTMSAVTLIRYSNAQISVSSELSRSHYAAEGAVNRAIMALYRDIRLYPDRKLGQTDYFMMDSERYLADAVIHSFDVNDRRVRIRITDANSGIDVSSYSPE